MGHVLDLEEIDQTLVAAVGGKGARLGELSRIEGIQVPAGFCVTTAAFQSVIAGMPSSDERLEELSRLGPDDRDAISAISAQLRRLLEGAEISGELAAAISRAVARLGEHGSYAVRSSAIAEDLPAATPPGKGWSGEEHGVSAILRQGDRIFHTYSSYGRGTEVLMGTYLWLDLTARGRHEDWELAPRRGDDPPMSWLRRHDVYGA